MSLDDRLRAEVHRRASQAPAAVDPASLATVVARTRHRRQQRAVAVAACIAAVLVVVATSVGGTSRLNSTRRPEPVTTPSPDVGARDWATFVSPLYGYRVRYPAGWSVTPAKRRWVHGKDRTDATDDVFQSPGKPAIHIAVQQLPAGWTAQRWKNDFVSDAADQPMPECFPTPSHWIPATIAGHAAGEIGRIPWCSFSEGVVVIGDEAVTITGMTDPTRVNPDIFDEGILRPVFRSLRLPPR